MKDDTSSVRLDFSIGIQIGCVLLPTLFFSFVSLSLYRNINASIGTIGVDVYIFIKYIAPVYFVVNGV